MQPRCTLDLTLHPDYELFNKTWRWTCVKCTFHINERVTSFAAILVHCCTRVCACIHVDEDCGAQRNGTEPLIMLGLHLSVSVWTRVKEIKG